MPPADYLARPGTSPRASVSGATEPKADLLLYALAAMIFTYVWRVQDLFPALAVIRPTILTLGVALAVYALDRDPRRQLGLIGSTIVGLMVALHVVILVGLPASLVPAGSVVFFVKELLPTLLFALLLVAGVRGVRDVEWLALVNLVGALFFTLIVYVRYDVGEDGRWGGLVYYDSNDLALLIVSTIPFAVMFMRRGAGVGRRAFALAAFGILVLALIKSGSRGGFLGFVVVLAYLLVRYRAVPARVRMFSVVAGVLLLALAGTEKYWGLIQTLLNPRQDYNWAGGAYYGRMELWKRGLGYVADHPLLGVGVGAFPVAEGELSEVARKRMSSGLPVKRSVAHNMYLEVAAEAGLPALLLFVAMLAVALRAAAVIARAPPSRGATEREPALGHALVASLIGYAVCGFFISAEHFSYLYMVLALVAGLLKLHRMRMPIPHLAEPRYRPSAQRAYATPGAALQDAPAFGHPAADPRA
jgi:O-antigen ligase